MANENLQNVLKTAGLSVEQFAEVIQVDPKSVQRWVIGPTIPYPRHRARIAQALDLSVEDLWPGQAPGSTVAEPDQAPAAAGRVGDVMGAWAYADDPGAPDLVAFVSDGTGSIDVLDSCCEIEITTELTDALLEHAEAGCAVRILTDGRSPHWEPLLTNEQVELYLCEIPGEYWLIKTSQRMLVAVNLEDQPVGSPLPPLLELIAASPDGFFHRLASKFDELWELTKDSGTAAADQVGSAAGSRTVKHEPVAEPGIGSDAGGRRWPGQRS